ncbi:Transcription factor bHLH18 [Heracleum sosnowskyi]|uniref:Transcription factor bHLH18 n=1 Tax=Heracleum sosnowskyi TaxID=360622 RepID=A0AAD8GMV1_9APIA|nr:Transcription factor bHLH18 [Heracleum sosnowskyi]
MDMSSALWLSELEMDDPIVRHQQSLVSVFDHEMATFNSSFSSESYSDYDYQSIILDTPVSSFKSEMEVIMKPAKMPKTNNIVNRSVTKSTIPKRPSPASSSAIISFEKADSTPIHWDDKKLTYLMKPAKKENLDTNFGDEGDFSYSYNSNGSLYHGFEISQENNTALPVKRTPLQAQDHVLAERKRRERLTQRFITLSSLVPGLKKMDKASVLEDATKYIKQLQERVKTLEEETVTSNAKNQDAVSLKRSRIYIDEESSSSNEDSDCYPRESFPEIEVRISEGNVLFRVQSKNIPGLAVKLFSKIEKLHMTIVSSSVMPFSSSSLLITIFTQMDEEFCMSANDLVNTLKSTLLELKSNQ